MQKRKIGQTSQKKGSNSLGFKVFLVLVSVVLLSFLIQPLAKEIGRFFHKTARTTVNVISSTVGDPMKKDNYGNVNVLLVGYGGEGHGGGYLADSTIVASRNPKMGALTMLSVPRDLYVKNPLGGYSRLNVVFTQLYGRTKSLAEAGSGYAKELEKITGLEIPYYATIDFSGFEELIDSIGGIDIDVPFVLHDNRYPDKNLRGYDPLHVEAGWQHMDGALALKYTRSRHALGHSSDFDRALRQQLVIDAIKNKVLSGGNISLNMVKDLYAQYTKIVNTNIKLDEILRTVQYIDKIQMFSFGLNTSSSQKGGFLYSPSRDLFGGAAVLLPIGATSSTIGKYDAIHNYVHFITHVQSFLSEQPKITIKNGVDTELLRANGLSNVPIAGRLATKMRRFGIEVKDTQNTDPELLTKIIINTESEKEKGFEGTVDAIQYFLPIDTVEYYTGVVKSIVDDYGNEVEVFTGSDIELILGASYLSGLQNSSFNPNALDFSRLGASQS